MSEVGHAKNVANLQKLIEQVTVFTGYNPSVPNLSVASLQTLYTTAVAQLNALEEKRNAYKSATYARQQAFDNLKPLTTKIFNFLIVLDLPEGLLNQARSLHRTIQGYTNPSTTVPPPEGSGGAHSTSRQSYTQQAENFGILLQLLATIPSYTPNEDDLKLLNLSTYHTQLVGTTKPVDRAEAEFNVELIQRNEILFTEKSGLYDIAKNVKKYVKSVYGGGSRNSSPSPQSNSKTKNKIFSSRK